MFRPVSGSVLSVTDLASLDFVKAVILPYNSEYYHSQKGKPQTKIEQLTEQIKCAFKIGETDTCKSVAKRFYEIAQTAVSIEASMTLEMQQAQSEIIAETAVMTMGG